MRRGLVLLAVVATLAAAPSAGAASWAQPQIQIVVEHGLMGPSVAEFRPRDPLTREQLGYAMAVLTGKPQVVVDPTHTVTVAQFDRRLVTYLGLGPAAVHFRDVLAAAGLEPPARLGTETVARLLRLRFNHPADADNLEPRPGDPITRAEAAYSLARLLELTQYDVDGVNALSASFSLPAFTAWQDRVLTRAVRFVGFPYIWGGIWEHPQVLFGVPDRGGFDCSGLVWRVYKLEPYPGGGQLQYVIQGRTTYEMSGEVPKGARISFDHLRPGDVLFFGDAGVNSKPSQIGHTGIYLGRRWFIHSSGQGVTLVPLTGWYADTFAWARRPLREAGLT
ncbi:MAG TPA: NlpC/P60 family protein [Gaiellaceae bacterium]|jgi:cell wall-associated NlpC family hydrolase|nr:NlpC/P60 family protein [Gaiellaceae bacterium]